MRGTLASQGGAVLLFSGGSVRVDEVVSAAGVIWHWDIIKRAESNGYAEYDLHGASDQVSPGDPLHGVTAFKRRWGGELVRLIGAYIYAP